MVCVVKHGISASIFSVCVYSQRKRDNLCSIHKQNSEIWTEFQGNGNARCVLLTCQQMLCVQVVCQNNQRRG
jgi:hypothetical protein